VSALAVPASSGNHALEEALATGALPSAKFWVRSSDPLNARSISYG